MEDLGHKMPQGSSGYREDGKFLREEARPSLALSWVTSKPCRSIPLSWCVLEGIQLSPCQQPDGNVEAEDHLLLVLLLFLLFLFKTATTEDPASHLPDIFSETLCWPAKPYGSVLPLRIPLMRPLFLKDGVGKWEQSREKKEGSLVP